MVAVVIVVGVPRSLKIESVFEHFVQEQVAEDLPGRDEGGADRGFGTQRVKHGDVGGKASGVLAGT